MKRHTFRLVFYLTSIVLVSVVTGDNLVKEYLPFQDPNTCNQLQNLTFSSISLGCINCVKDKEKTRGFISSCSCPPNHVLVYSQSEEAQKIGSRTKCVQCPENAVTYDQRNCLACYNQTKVQEFTAQCPLCPAGSVLVHKEHNGETKKTAECVQCKDGFTPSLTGEECIPCHPSFPTPTGGLCQCPDSDQTHTFISGICFTNAEVADPHIERNALLFKVQYDNGHRVESPFFRENLVSAFYLCKVQRNVTACQLLANMCTLLLHSYESEHNNACTLYRIAVPEPHHPPPYIPKLYYISIEAPTLLARTDMIPTQFDMNLDESSSDINLTVSRVSMDGTFKGLSLLTDIIPCAEPARVKKIAQKFGSTYKTSCVIPIQDLWNRHAEMEFLDSYLSIQEDNELKLYPIPIKILNYRSQRNGKANEMDDNHQWQLVRRFFMVDTIDPIDSSGRTEGKYKSTKLIRYLEKIHIGIQLQNSQDPGKIYVPLMTLSYKEMDVESFRQNEQVYFEFKIDYFMDMSRSLEDVKISVSVISSLTVLWAAMQAWSWNRRSGRPYIDITTIANLLIYTCGHVADAFFVVCFGASLFWFFFFKKQAAVHILLPLPEQEKLIKDLLISAFSLKIVEVIRLIVCQVDVDIFFIDWERPKAKASPRVTSATKPGSGGMKMTDEAAGTPTNTDNNPENNVSIWRTYFIANEWNEIQSSRKIHMACQILVTIFFLEIIGFKHWALSWPSGSVDPGPEHRNIPYSTTARFAIGSLVFLTLGTIQWAFRVTIFDRFISNKIQDFVDVCTLANISVFILAANQYGYYIHGRSVHGFSDTCMQTMVEQLNREEEDLCGRRGLLPSTDQQTFLISVANSFRSVYNQVLQPLYATTNANVKGRIQLGGVASKLQSSSKQTSAMLTLSVQAYHSMNRFLTAFLEHALSDLDYDVTEKSFFESTFDMEFGDVTQDRAIFYTDNGHSFDSILFYGNERTLFLFNLYTFIFVEILSHNFILAGIITYLTDMIVKCIRHFLGKRNLGRKTLIQERFLI